MLKTIDAVRLTLGLKVHLLRRQLGLSYQQLSDKTGLAVSYLHNIEKGRKYPKGDKILALAKALGTDYDYLVSLEADKQLQPVIDLLHWDFLRVFPLEDFGIDTNKFIELVSQAPDKVNAFISTVLKITRNYQLQGEDFYKAALRSYQDLHDNYFPELELAVRRFRKDFGFSQSERLNIVQLEELLVAQFSIQVERSKLPGHPTLSNIRSYFQKETNTLFINAFHHEAHESFLIAKELGFQYLQLNPRPQETRMLEIETFDHLLNNFKASYFAVALLIDEGSIVQDIHRIAARPNWEPDLIISLLNRYNVTSEVLLQRLANVFPKHFAIFDLFFLRFYTQPDMEKFEMTKEMHLSQLHNPYANQLDEHYCRRWISINSIQRLRALPKGTSLLADAQISNYVDSENAYLCISLAKPSTDAPESTVSVTLGLLINDRLKQVFRFLDDPSLDKRDVHTTCERCPITDCQERAAPPVVLNLEKKKQFVQHALSQLNTQQ